MNTEASRLPPSDRMERLKYVYIVSLLFRPTKSALEALMIISLTLDEYLKIERCGTVLSTLPFIYRNECCSGEEHCVEGFWFYREE